mgnify:FL=1
MHVNGVSQIKAILGGDNIKEAFCKESVAIGRTPVATRMYVRKDAGKLALGVFNRLHPCKRPAFPKYLRTVKYLLNGTWSM